MIVNYYWDKVVKEYASWTWEEKEREEMLYGCFGLLVNVFKTVLDSIFTEGKLVIFVTPF